MRGPQRGFTLLEVLVAVAILGLALTAIFSSQAGAVKVAHRARKTTMATSLARCKMGELEEQVANEGLPAIEDHDTDGCCEDSEIDGFSCEWSIERIQFPDSNLEDSPLDASGDDENGDGNDESPAALAQGADVDEILAGAAGQGQDLVGEFALSYAWPVLRPIIEEQVRRAVVTVRWKEGARTHSFDVVQYLVSTVGAGAPALGGTSTDDPPASGTNPGSTP